MGPTLIVLLHALISFLGGLRGWIREVGLKIGMLRHLVSWVELAEPLGGAPNVPILPLNFMFYVLMGSVTFDEKLEVPKDPRWLAKSLLSRPCQLLWIYVNCSFQWTNPRLTKDSVKLTSNWSPMLLSNVSLTSLWDFANMTKWKAADRITPGQEKSKGIAIYEDAATSKVKAMKLPTNIGKGKGKRPTSAKKTITLDPNLPSWARGFCRAVHVFLEDSHSTKLGEFGNVVPPEVTPGTDAQDDASCNNSQTDGATA